MNRYAVIGLGRFGAKVAQGLADHGAEVLAIDSDIQAVDAMRGSVDQAMVLNATDEVAFRASGVEDVDTVVVAIGRHLEVSIVVTAQLVRMAAPHIIARASSPIQEQILRLIGAHEVVNPEVAMGETVARRLVAPELRDRRILPTGHEFVEIAARPSQLGHTLGELDITGRYGLRLLAVRKHRPGVDNHGRNIYVDDLLADPDASTVIEDGDVLAVVGTDAQVRALTRER